MGVSPVVVAFAMMQTASVAWGADAASSQADEGNDVEVAEPFFMEKAAVEKSLEFEAGLDKSSSEKEYELGVGFSWVFFDRLQLGVDVPYVILDPTGGSTESGIGDVEFSAKYQIFDIPDNGFNFSLAGAVAIPSGSRDKETGGTGEWSVAALADKVVPAGMNTPELDFHLNLAYSQEIRLSNEEMDTAAMLGLPNTREKELLWGGAVEMPLADGRVTPDLEIVGTTILDAVDPDEEGTIVELGGGVWLAPFPEDSEWAPVSIGAGVKAPITNKRESDFSALIVAKYDFE